ncbi:MAG: TetR/AcrR family transcriptional regulator [Alphaproteobacteria bacterium]|nr:MAG: TetR/AcrR family transcriptional regulator [Alphaproteobacteria bacterium]
MTTGSGTRAEETTAAQEGSCARDALLDLAVGLIAAHGWLRFRLGALADEAGCSPADVRRHFATRYDLLVALSERADAAMFAAAEEIRPDDLPRDRLHAVLMARFAAAAGDRAALGRLLQATVCDPLLAAVHLRNLHAWARRALLLAGLAASHPLAALIQEKVLATAVIVPVLPRWIRDESTDLAATEAALDRAIERAWPLLAAGRAGSAESPGGTTEDAGRDAPDTVREQDA